MITRKILSLAECNKAANFRAAAVGLAAAVVLSACAEGGGAGDVIGDLIVDEDPVAVALITPFVGVYDLPSNWDGFPENEAYLEIQVPNDAGVATAVIFRQDSVNNCIESRPSIGEVKVDPFLDNTVVLDDIFELENAILSLTTVGLTIELPLDVQDIDGDSDFDETATLQAERLGIMASDLGESCANAALIWI